MNLVLLTEGTGQGVHGRKTNVSRLYDLLVENGNQRINLEAGPGTRPFRHLAGTFFGADALSIVRGPFRTVRTRPRSSSIACIRREKSNGSSVVSKTAI